MAREGAFTLSGFQTPEQVRERIGKARLAEEEALAANFGGGSPAEFYGRTAFKAGRQAARSINPPPESPEIALAKQRQDVLKDIDFTTSKGLYSGADKLLKNKDVAGAGELIAQALKVRKLEVDELDASSGGGSSEFERGINHLLRLKKITPEEAARRIDERSKGFAESGLTTVGGIRKTERDTERYDKLVKQYRGDAKTSLKPLGDSAMAIESAISALKSGNSGLADKFAVQAMSQMRATDVRAFQMYEEFDKGFGNLWERMLNTVSKVATGEMSDAQKDIAIADLEGFRDQHIKPMQDRMHSRQWVQAHERGIDPFHVIPPRNKFDIKGAWWLNKKAKRELIKKYAASEFAK